MKIKKFIALLLCFTLLVPVFVMPSSAEVKEAAPVSTVNGINELESAFADGENSLVVFVTGIGQSHSYIFDKSYVEEGAFENGTLQDYENYAPLVAEGKYIDSWNLFNDYFDESLKDPETLKGIIGAVFQLLLGAVTRKNMVSDKNVNAIVKNLFRYNLVDEQGNLDPRVVTPRYTLPLSKYPGVIDENGKFNSEAKNCFYSSIPCAEICEKAFGENYEDYLYCYNYSAFSYTSKNVAGLHEFIETILAENTVGADKVILVPMSMGASVVSSYLYAYPDVADNHVKRVVSIVGCWNGSDIVIDLITQHYADNSPDLFYNGLVAELVGEPWGYLVNFVLRFFSKRALRAFIDQALAAISDIMVLRTPSLLSLVPDYRYEDARALIKSDAVRAEFDTYHQAQSTIKERFAALEQQGVGFSFIAGYGLPYGAITSDYRMFGFMNSAEKTNSDEIIDISSTAPGTSYVSYSSEFSDEEGRILSPDKSIDISTTYYKDSTWYFYGQKHELEYNNTAISLAIQLALGNIKTVEDCDDADTDDYYYPQFNGARNVKSLKRSYLPDFEKYVKENNIVLTAEQQATYDNTLAMLDCTVNDYEADNAVIEQFRQMMIDMGIYSADKAPSAFTSFFNSTMKKGDVIIALPSSGV
ncbi:MAG: alpha/beta hydrolase, partial [Clostridia bacterium]|nr:alpha/beta hydrolase [Clostridia bacterium]